MDFFHFLIGTLAVHRLSLLVSKEDGPAFIFRKLRKAPPKKSSIDDGLSCQWCMSVHASALVCLWFWWQGMLPGSQWPLYWLAMSSAAICINQAFTKG